MRLVIALLLGLLAVPAAAQEYLLSTSQALAHTSTSATLATGFGSQTYAVRVVCTQSCFINVAKTPLVTAATGVFLPANVPSTIRVTPGMKIAVTAASTLGTLYVTELTK